MDLLRAAVSNALRVHPRVRQQDLVVTPEAREQLASALPPLVPFPGRQPHAVIAVVDWDHRLPSRHLYLRVFVFHRGAAAAQFDRAFAEREREIRRRDLFPEFDVPDFDELPGDEIYEAELTPELHLDSMRLVSAWRRDVEAATGAAAVERVRASDVFRSVVASEQQRPHALGDVEVVSWVPPCESGLDRWTVDVWWLAAFDGQTGRGWSFLVDPVRPEAADPVMAHREFSVRPG